MLLTKCSRHGGNILFIVAYHPYPVDVKTAYKNYTKLNFILGQCVMAAINASLCAAGFGKYRLG